MAKAPQKKSSGKGKPAPAKSKSPAKKAAPAVKKKPAPAKKAAPAAKKPTAPVKKAAPAPAKKPAPAAVKKPQPIAAKAPLKTKEKEKAPAKPIKAVSAAPAPAVKKIETQVQPSPVKAKTQPVDAPTPVDANARGAASQPVKQNRPIVVPEHFKKLQQQLEGIADKHSSSHSNERHQAVQSELFTDDELAKFLVVLQDERNKLLEKARAAVDGGNIALDKDEMYDEVDLASATVDQNLTFRLLDRDRKLLSEIDHAIAKIHNGEYGLCEGTGEAIPKRRLELRPWCKYSVKYKEQLEKLKKSGRGVVDEDEDMFA